MSESTDKLEALKNVVPGVTGETYPVNFRDSKNNKKCIVDF